MTHTVPFIRPSIPRVGTWAGYLDDSYASSQFSNGGPAVRRLERVLEHRFGGARRAVVASSCTAALHATLVANRTQGNVLLPSFTFAATAVAVTAAGCTPVFCDVSREDAYLEPALLETAVDRWNPGAIFVVRPFGLNRTLEDLARVAAQSETRLFADAAASLGLEALSTDNADVCEVFSLHATKAFGIGEGGVAFVPEDMVEKLRSALNFGLNGQDLEAAGLNGKMSEFQAAVALGVLDDLDAGLQQRRRVAVAYQSLVGLPGVEKVWAPTASPWSFFPIVLEPQVDRDNVVALLAERGVEARAYYRPLHTFSAFRSFPRTPMTNTEWLAKLILCLPVLADMAPHEIAAVVDALTDVLVSGV